jgi:hypothetical protein
MTGFNNTNTTDTLDEIESCLNLAETISRNIDKLQDRLLWLKTQFAALSVCVITSGLLFSIVYDMRLGSEASTVVYLGITLFVTIAFYFVLHYPRYIRTQEDLQVDVDLITRLITIIFSLQKILRQDVSLVTKTLIEMRLSRIRFSPNS